MAIRPTLNGPGVPIMDEPDRSTGSGTHTPQSTPATPRPTGPAAPEPPRSRPGRLLGKMRATPARRFALKIGVGVLGALVVIVGIILLPLPGPGWAIIFAGLAIWSIEFHWARRVLLFAKTRVFLWRTWYSEQGWPLRILVGVATALVVLAIVAGAFWLSVGPAVWRLLHH